MKLQSLKSKAESFQGSHYVFLFITYLLVGFVSLVTLKRSRRQMMLIIVCFTSLFAGSALPRSMWKAHQLLLQPCIPSPCRAVPQLQAAPAAPAPGRRKAEQPQGCLLRTKRWEGQKFPTARWELLCHGVSVSQTLGERNTEVNEQWSSLGVCREPKDVAGCAEACTELKCAWSRVPMQLEHTIQLLSRSLQPFCAKLSPFRAKTFPVRARLWQASFLCCLLQALLSPLNSLA